MRRSLTVSTLRRSWGSLYRTRYDVVPALRINGHWLEQAGFVPGEKVTVQVEERSLTIHVETCRQSGSDRP
jgi:hypothetical protein